MHIIKFHPAGTVEHLKARLVVVPKGYTQTCNVDNAKTSSPVSKLASIHVINFFATNLA